MSGGECSTTRFSRSDHTQVLNSTREPRSTGHASHPDAAVSRTPIHSSEIVRQDLDTLETAMYAAAACPSALQVYILKSDVRMEEFEWDEAKAKTNLEKHGVDFRDAAAIFECPILQTRSDRSAEQRLKAVSTLRDQLIVVVYTLRSGRRRIISARRAGKHEREAYRQAISEES